VADVNQWFQNTRGLVIVGLAVATCAVLLAVEPGDSFPRGASVAAAGGSGATVTTVPAGPTTTTTTTISHPQIQQGSTGADVTVLQQRLNTLGFNVGAPDGSFGPGTKAAVIAFQNQKKITPADGVVNAATWAALLAN
jgi:peptidoglycan hydrolase-like protein with peptidoglycan-binding domain